MTSTWLGGETPLTTARDSSALQGVGLGISKKDRADLLKNDKKTYFKVRDNAVKGMTSKFTQLQAIDEKATLDHLEKVYSIVNRFSDLLLQMQQNDMADVFTIPDAFVLDSTTGHYLPSPTAKPVNLFTSANIIDLETAKHATAYFARYGAAFHGENVLWSGEKILNSCDESLRDKLVESTRTWDRADVGGPSYLKLLLYHSMSTTQKSLRALLDKLGKIRITDFPGENVTKAVSFLRGAILILRDNSSTPTDIINLTLRVFKVSSCEPFRTYVGSIDNFVELKVKQYELDDLLSMLDAKYIELLGRGEWTARSSTEGQQSGFTADTNLDDLLRIICYNCGGVGHGVNNCPHPRDDKMINLRRDIIQNSGGGRRNRSNNRSDSSTMGNGGNGNGNGRPNDPLLQPPGKNEPHEKLFDGVKKFWCGKPGCRRWTDHTSREHPGGASAHVADQGTTPPPVSVPSTDTSSVAGTEVSGTPSTLTHLTEATGATGHFATILPTIPHHFG